MSNSAQNEHTNIRPRVLLAACGSAESVKFGLLCHCFLEWAEVQAVVTEVAWCIMDHKLLPKGLVVYTDKDEWLRWRRIGDSVLHIELRTWADIMVIAPLSANTLAKKWFRGQVAGGQCDDLLTCVVRAWDYKKPIFVAPSMDAVTWTNSFTEQHLMTVDELGMALILPVPNPPASYARGGMAHPTDINTTVRMFWDKHSSAS